MNNCILVAQILQDPQLRYTSDTQIEIAEMLVQFEGTREGEPPSRLKVVAWRNLALEVQKRFRQGDRVAIEGRLSMSTIDRPEGFKEKRAELVAQRIFAWGSNEAPLSNEPAMGATAPAPVSAPAPAAYAPAPASVGVAATPAPPVAAPVPQVPTAPPAPPMTPPPPNEPLEDDIPF